MELDIKTLLNLVNGVVGVADVNKKTITQVYFDSNNVDYNLSYNEFIDRLTEAEGVDPSSFDKEEYILWLNQNHVDRSIGFNVKSLQGKELDYNVKISHTTDPNLVAFIFQRLDESASTTHLVDPLTRLFLKNGIESIANNELESDKPHPFSLIIIDIDNFKVINDIYGHLFGDHILKEVSKIFKRNFKNSYIGRIGGDEFLIIDFNNPDYNNIWNEMHNMYEDIRHTDFKNLANDIILKNSMSDSNLENFKITISSGLARFPYDGTTYEELFTKADKALYRGKRKGKNCFIIYKQELHGNISVDKNTESDFGYRDTLIFETLISNFITKLESGVEFVDSITDSITSIGDYFQLDRISVYKHTGAFKDELVSIYVNPNVPEASSKYVIPKVEETDEAKAINLKNPIHRVSVEHLSQKPGLYKYLKSQNVKSFAQYPIMYNDVLYGFIRFDACQSQRNWSEEEIAFYKIVSNILSLYIYNYYAINEKDYLLNVDNLTGLYDYKSTVNKINGILKSKKKRMVILYTDLYKFRYYNDNYGYDAGDNVLRVVTKTLLSQNFELCGRANGDHFISIFEYVDETTTRLRIEKLIKDFNVETIGIPGDIAIEMLIGAYVNQGEVNAKACIDKARLALLDINKNSTDKYKIYDTKLEATYIRNKNIISRFEKALKENDLEILYQPKIDATTGKIVGAEALSRWHMDGDILSPAQFIPLLESNGLIENLDIYVFTRVMSFMKLLKQDHRELVPISFNVSRRLKNVSKYIDKIDEIRRRFGIEAKYVEIEFTETSFNFNYDDVFNAVTKLRNLGYKIDMDDFGTGYSNLDLLSKGIFDVVKMDKSLIDTIDTDHTQILSYSINLAKSLGLDIVCEGVETENQKDIILTNGGKIIQGYYYSKPLNGEEFIIKYLNK
jgi:diguanylate cyclase (GGDEF)-like protein